MLQKIVEFFHGGAFRKALTQQEQVKTAHRSHLLRNVMGFTRIMDRVQGKHIVFGTHEDGDTHTQVRIPLEGLLTHHLIQGRSGSGKSRLTESIILQILQSLPGIGIVLVDGKGELYERIRLWLAALLHKMEEKKREQFLQRIVIVDPFHSSVIPPFNVCIPPAEYPAELLAEDILGGLRRLFVDTPLSVRMEVPLRHVIIALVEAGKAGRTLSLLESKELLTDEKFRGRVLEHVKNEETRAYFVQDFSHETKGTIEALKSRISYLLLSEHIRLGFGADRCVEVQEALEQGKIILVNLGKSRFATDTARDVIGTLFLSSFVRAVFSRPMNAGPYVLTFMDEFQNFIVPDVFIRLFTEARAYRCFVTAICQQLAAQVSSRSLREVIVNNVRYITLFSSTEEDARLLARVMFRPSGCVPRPRDPFSSHAQSRFYTESEELELFTRSIPSLALRSCYFWDKENPFGAQRIVTQAVPEPHAYAGLGKDEFQRFVRECEPLWKRMGNTKEEARRILEERRRHWGIGVHEPLQLPATVHQSRKSLLKELEAHLGTADNSEE